MTEKQILEPVRGPAGSREEPMVIDTSNMSEGKRASLEIAESSREAAGEYPTFAGQLFMGKLPWEIITPFPAQSDEDRAMGNAFLEQLKAFLRDKVDADRIDAEGEIPDEVMEGLARLGAFGIKIPIEYGGLGLSQTNYCRAATVLGSHCGNLSALLSAHQSIGIPQPLLMFGTEEQKREYLPRMARGEISAFALTEEGVGSDPARMETTAEPSEDGSHFILKGRKLWCTNGTRASVLVVMARTPSKFVNGKERPQITGFIVETNWPGVEIERRCRFMGLKSLYNGVISFRNVRVPRRNILLAEGKGLRVALTTLNIGRLTLPAISAGTSKLCLRIVRDWCNEREQWGVKIGQHEVIADKISRHAAGVFATESITLLSAGLVDRMSTDIRIEAALCKMWGTEEGWRILDETMQVRGGRGYETADSLRARGDKPIAVERMMRDSRINLIFEGSSEIMRLFIAREALDPHLKLGADVMNAKLSVGVRIRAGLRALAFYGLWYPRLLFPRRHQAISGMHPVLRRHARAAERASRKLARSLFRAMVRYGPGLESRQILLRRLVDIGADIFVIAACCSRAQHLAGRGRCADNVLAMADYACREAALRIRNHHREIRENNDRQGCDLAGSILDGEYGWIEDGIIEQEYFSSGNST